MKEITSTDPENNGSKVYYSMGEVAEMFGVKPSLIRFWESEFEVIRPYRNKKGNRLFTPEDVRNFRLIFHLVKERGFTLQGAKDKIRDNREDTVNNAEVVHSLNRIRDFLTELKKEL